MQETTSYYQVISYIYRGNNFYGTGSLFMVYNNGSISESYTVIVQRDINGDSAVDVLDAAAVTNVANGHIELTGNYFLAADTNFDKEITVEDYAQIVNLVLSSKTE